MSVVAALWSEIETRRDFDILRLHGDLSLVTAGRVRTLLGKLLHDRGALVVDLAGLRLQRAPAAEVFPGALAAAGGWPVARMVLVGADAELAARLHAVRVHRTVPVVADLSDAPAVLRQRPQRVTRHRDLPAALRSPAAARSLVRAACADWRLLAVEDAAALVASELVTNVVEHTVSTCRVSLSLGPLGLHVGVRDYAPGPAPRPRPVDLTQGRGRGLHIVSTLGTSWGVSHHEDGKTVWAVLPV
jgi:anti-sigma regulatory factor (Ser/Thr protein kinase)